MHTSEAINYNFDFTYKVVPSNKTLFKGGTSSTFGWRNLF